MRANLDELIKMKDPNHGGKTLDELQAMPSVEASTNDDSFLSNVWKGFKSGGAGVYGGIADIAHLDSAGNYLNDVVKSNQRSKDYDSVFSLDYWLNPSGAAYDAGNTIGSMAALAPAAFLLPESVAAGGAAAITGLLGRLGAQQLAKSAAIKAAAQTFIRGAATAVPESLSEGGNVRRDAIEKGLPDADARAWKTAAMNLPTLALSNGLEYMLLGGKAFHPSAKAGESIAQRAVKAPFRAAPAIGANAVQNAGEELIQQTISDAQTDQPWGNPLNPAAWTPSQRQAFEVGGAMGGLLGGAANGPRAMMVHNDPLQNQDLEAAKAILNQQNQVQAQAAQAPIDTEPTAQPAMSVEQAQSRINQSAPTISEENSLDGFDNRYVTKWESQPGATDLANVQPSVKNRFNAMMAEYGDSVILTGGAETGGYHQGGGYGHEGGWKLDVDINSVKDKEKFLALCKKYGFAVGDESDKGHYDLSGHRNGGVGGKQIVTPDSFISDGGQAASATDADMSRFNSKQREAWNEAQWVEQQTGIPAEYIYRQWAHESGNFTSRLATENNNFGGLTQSTPNGEENKQPDGGNYYRMYNNMHEYAESYVKDFINRYDGKENVKSMEDFVNFLHSNGYFTADPSEYLASMQGVDAPTSRTGYKGSNTDIDIPNTKVDTSEEDRAFDEYNKQLDELAEKGIEAPFKTEQPTQKELVQQAKEAAIDAGDMDEVQRINSAERSGNTEELAKIADKALKAKQKEAKGKSAPATPEIKMATPNLIKQVKDLAASGKQQGAPINEALVNNALERGQESELQDLVGILQGVINTHGFEDRKAKGKELLDYADNNGIDLAPSLRAGLVKGYPKAIEAGQAVVNKANAQTQPNTPVSQQTVSKQEQVQPQPAQNEQLTLQDRVNQVRGNEPGTPVNGVKVSELASIINGAGSQQQAPSQETKQAEPTPAAETAPVDEDYHGFFDDKKPGAVREAKKRLEEKINPFGNAEGFRTVKSIVERWAEADESNQSNTKGRSYYVHGNKVSKAAYDYYNHMFKNSEKAVQTESAPKQESAKEQAAPAASAEGNYPELKKSEREHWEGIAKNASPAMMKMYGESAVERAEKEGVKIDENLANDAKAGNPAAIAYVSQLAWEHSMKNFDKLPKVEPKSKEVDPAKAYDNLKQLYKDITHKKQLGSDWGSYALRKAVEQGYTLSEDKKAVVSPEGKRYELSGKAIEEFRLRQRDAEDNERENVDKSGDKSAETKKATDKKDSDNELSQQDNGGKIEVETKESPKQEKPLPSSYAERKAELKKDFEEVAQNRDMAGTVEVVRKYLNRVVVAMKADMDGLVNNPDISLDLDTYLAGFTDVRNMIEDIMTPGALSAFDGDQKREIRGRVRDAVEAARAELKAHKNSLSKQEKPAEAENNTVEAPEQMSEDELEDWLLHANEKDIEQWAKTTHYKKVAQSGSTFIIDTFYNTENGKEFTICVRDYDYDGSRDINVLYEMPIDKDAYKAWQHKHGKIVEGDVVEVVKGRKVPVGTISRVKKIRSVRDKYGRWVADYADLENGQSTNVTNCQRVEEAREEVTSNEQQTESGSHAGGHEGVRAGESEGNQRGLAGEVSGRDGREGTQTNGSGEEENAAGLGQPDGVREGTGLEETAGSGTDKRGNQPTVPLTEAEAHPSPTEIPGHNYEIKDTDESTKSEKVRFKQNVDAIKMLKQLEADDRMPTPAEQEILGAYNGWGGLKSAFLDGNEMNKELRDLLTEDEYKAARATINDAFYTPPKIIRAIWEGVSHLGFKGGRVLDPSMGVGNFFGTMPRAMMDKSALRGVELDNLTSRFAKMLYPSAFVENKGFQKAGVADNYFDLAISNIPFGQSMIDGYQVHNYFFANGIDKVRPGGLMVYITSQGSLAGGKDAVKMRNYLAGQADLIAAYKLPSGVFSDAGTQVATDIVIFRKRDKDGKKSPYGQNFSDIKDVKAGNWRYAPTAYTINEYFEAHPENILGEKSAGTDQWGNPALNVKMAKGAGLADVANDLASAMKKLPEDVYKPVSRKKAKAFDVVSSNKQAVANEKTRDLEYYYKDGKPVQNQDGQEVALTGQKAKVVDDYLKVKNTLNALFIAESDPKAKEKDVEGLRKKLNKDYDNFVAKHGQLTGKAAANFKDDPSAGMVQALEKPIEETYTDKKGNERKKIVGAEKADIFTTRSIKPVQEVTHVENADDALIASLTNQGTVDLDYMAELMNSTPEKIVSKLKGKLFKNPTTEDYETRDEYLAGNVREKLAQAKEAAKSDKSYMENVKELEKVIPEDLVSDEIYVNLGTPWIPVADVQAFVNTLNDNIKVNFVRGVALWNVQGYSYHGNAKYKLNGISLSELLDHVLNNKAIQIYDGRGDDRVFNQEKTDAANVAAEELQQDFKDWIWKDKEREKRLVKYYNDNYNNTVVRQYDGQHLNLHNYGMNAKITLKPHQKDVVWRMLQGGNTLIAHCVGAGKTFEMQAAGMEMRRLGIANKPMYCLPNNVVEQFAREFRQLYPNAKLLVLQSKDLPAVEKTTKIVKTEDGRTRKENLLAGKTAEQKAAIMEKRNARNRMLNRIRTEDWDGIIISHNLFQRFPVTPDTAAAFIQQEIDNLEQTIREAKADKSMDTRALSRMEDAKKNLQDRLDETISTDVDDIGIPFEELGIDQLFVDEADMFKNLEFATRLGNIRGLSNSKAKRSQDMFIKTQWLTNNMDGRGVVFATGTPVSNTMSELYTMMRYLDMKGLKEKGLELFDNWMRTFGDIGQGIERKPTGDGFRKVTMIKRFINMAELTKMFRSFADVKVQDELNLNIPKLKNDKVTVVALEPDAKVVNYIKNVVPKRVKAMKSGFKKAKGEDNMLSLTNDLRKLSLTDDKIEACADAIVKKHNDTTDVKGTQLVFCDMGIPKAESDKVTDEDSKVSDIESPEVYRKLIAMLKEKGIHEKDIAFIQNYNTKEKRDGVFQKVNKGDVRILIGSTETMGAGTNCQEHLVALHDLDAPWRPRDLEQRHGRILRQGNNNKEVEIFNYVVKDSFDANMWEKLKNKAAIIQQAMSGDMTMRTVEDADLVTLSYAEVEGAATGNPLIKEQLQVQNDLTKYQHAQTAFRKKVRDAENVLAGSEETIAEEERVIAKIKKDIAECTDTKGDKFSMLINGKGYKDRGKADEALAKILNVYKQPQSMDIGKIGGFRLTAIYKPSEDVVQLQLVNNRAYKVKTNSVQGIENTLRKAPDESLESRQKSLDSYKQDVAQAEEIVSEENPYAEKVKELSDRLNQLNREIEDTLVDDGRQKVEQAADTTIDSEPETEAEKEVKLTPKEKAESELDGKLIEFKQSLENAARIGDAFEQNVKALQDSFDKTLSSYKASPAASMIDDYRKRAEVYAAKVRSDYKKKSSTKPKFSMTGEMKRALANAKVISESDYTRQERKVAEFGNTIGTPVVWIEAAPKMHGFHVFTDMVIDGKVIPAGSTVLNRRSNMPLSQVFWHETFHWIANARGNEAVYDTLMDYFKGKISKAQLDAFVKQNGRTDLTTDKDIIEEMLADAFEDVSQRVKIFKEMGAEQPSLARKFVAWVKRIMDKFTEFFHNPEGKLTTAQRDSFVKAFGRLARDMKDGNGRPLFKVYNDGKEIRLPSGELATTSIKLSAGKANNETQKHSKPSAFFDGASMSFVSADVAYNEALYRYQNAKSDSEKEKAYAELKRLVEQAAKEAGFENAIPEQTVAYKTRTKAAPKKSIKVYKVFTVSNDGSPTALFIGGTEKLPQGVWLDAQDAYHFKAANGKYYVPSTQNPYTKGGKTGVSVEIPNDKVRQELIKRGFLKPGSTAAKVTALAYRPGWHAGTMPFFPQGGMKPPKGMNSAYPNIHRYNQVVFECELAADKDYTQEAENQPKARKKDGSLDTRNADLQYMPENGYYYYATNPLTHGHPELGMWAISGSLKINRALSQEECDKILADHNMAPQEWEQGEMKLEDLGYTGQQYDAARKTLAPITYDDNGKVIPLSERFNAEVDDIRFSYGPSDNSSEGLWHRIKNIMAGKGNEDSEKFRYRKHLTEMIEKALDVKLRYGKMEGNKSQVVYKPEDRVLRSRHAFDWENILPVAGRIAAERLGIEPTESMNNYIADWILTGAPNNVSKEADTFHKAMRQHPAESAKLEDLRDAFAEWLGKDYREQMQGTIQWKNKQKPTMQERKNKLYEEFVEELEPINRMVKQVNANLTEKGQKKLGITADPMVAFRMLRGSYGRAMAALEGVNDGAVDALKHAFPNVDFTGFKTLYQILKSIDAFQNAEKQRDFVTYCTACHIMDMHQHNDDIRQEQQHLKNKIEKLGTSKEDEAKKKEYEADIEKLSNELMPIPAAYSKDNCQKYINDGYDKYHAAQQDLVHFSNTTAAMLADSGVISEKRFQELLTKWQNYVPLFRVFEDNEDINFGDSMKHIKGSTRDIVNPLESIIRNTAQFIQKAELNKAKCLLADVARCDASGWLLEEVDKSDSDKTTITFWENGQRKYLQTDPDIVRAVNNMGADSSHFFIKFLHAITRLARACFTMASPEFALRNVARDWQDATLYTKHGMWVNPLDIIRGFIHAWKKDDVFYEWLTQGAAQASALSLDRDYTQSTLDKLGRGYWKRLTSRDWYNALLEGLQMAGEYSEYGTRIAMYKKTKAAILKDKPNATKEELHEAMLEAAFESRDLMDFARHGKAGAEYNKITAFANASIQGWDKLYRSLDFRNDPKRATRTAAKLVLYGALPAMMIFAMYHDDDWYKDAPNWLKETHWLFKFGDTTIRIPKAADMGIRFISNAVEKGLDEAYNKHPHKAKEYFLPMWDALPGMLPTSILPIIEIQANHAFFTDRPIIPQGQDKLPAKLQYGPYTTSFAKWIGETFDIAPRSVEHFISGYTGTLGMAIPKAIDLVSGANQQSLSLEEMPLIRGYLYPQFKSPQSVSDYYEKLNEQTKLKNEYKLTHKRPEGFDPALLQRLENAQKQLRKISKQEKSIIDNPKWSIHDKEVMQRNIQKKRIEIAKRALGTK